MAKRIKKLSAMADTGLVAAYTSDTEYYISNSRVVSETLSVALRLNAQVDIETFDVAKYLIRRLKPFDVGPPTSGHISRIATQRNPDSGINWLEVFVVVDGREVAYLAFEKTIQLICLCAALNGQRLILSATDDKKIVEASCESHLPG